MLLPGYFDGTQETAYERLEHRFGPNARRAASAIFLVTRALGDSVRVFATAIPLAIITHWNLTAGILAVGVVTVFYTWFGGLGSARSPLLCAVRALRRRPGGLRLTEEVQELPLSELGEGRVGTLGSARRIAGDATLALGAVPSSNTSPNSSFP